MKHFTKKERAVVVVASSGDSRFGMLNCLLSAYLLS